MSTSELRSMIIIGEKINGAIPSVKQAIAERNEALIIERTLAQVHAGADFLDCAPSTATDIEYDTFQWLIGLMQDVTNVPLCIDSPNAGLLARIIEGPGRITMRHVLLGMSLVALFSGGLLLIPQPRAVLLCLFGAMGLMTMGIQPFVNAVGFGYMNRGARLNWSVTRGVASLAFALFSKVYAALAERNLDWLLGLYLLSTAGILVCSLLLAEREAPADGRDRC